MLVSKLSTRYPWANPATWLVFSNPDQADIDPIFAGRLAALAKDRNQKIHITGNGGKRDPEDQMHAYKDSGGHQLPDGTWTGGNGLAAKPGESTHELGLAVDTSDLWLKMLHKNDATLAQHDLIRFGLYKPLTKGNKSAVVEDWHIQPFEINRLTSIQRKVFKPVLVVGTVVEFQQKYHLTPDGIYGPKVDAKAKEVFKV